MPRLHEIHMRDPFILAVPEHRRHYLIGTPSYRTRGGAVSGHGSGLDLFHSVDLEIWDGPHTIFEPPDGFWGTHDFWAPELHQYDGRFYLFCSFKAADACRGTHILVADDVMGPYRPLGEQPPPRETGSAWMERSTSTSTAPHGWFFATSGSR